MEYNKAAEKVKMPEQAAEVRNHNFEEVALGYTEDMANEEASRCMNCKKKPCVEGCPVNVQIPEFLSKVKEISSLPTVSFEKPTSCRPSAVAYVPRKANAKGNASVGKRASRWELAVWNVFVLITQCPKERRHPEERRSIKMVKRSR